MNISYISGIKGHRRIGDMGKYGPGGACGIGGVLTGKDWAQSNGLMPYQSELWLAANNGLYRKYAAQKILLPATIGRAFVRKLIEKNAGGFANSLYKLRQASKTAQPSDPAYQKMRAIEIRWLEGGGNPYELYESIDEGNKKTPTGAYFNKLMNMKASGYTPNVAQWIAAGVSVVFGKKYNETTGQITGSNMGIGVEPVTDTVAAVSSAPWWAVMIGGIITTLGTALIAKGTPPAPGEEIIVPGGGGGGNTETKFSQAGLLPILIVGGAAAAYYFYSKNK